MARSEQAVTFQCQGDRLVGIVHRVPEPARRGVLIVVGGPQYRVGAHRQFVSLARRLSAEGIPVFRFDYRGMGDSEGKPRDFQDVDQDIAAALDSFMAEYSDLEEVVLWGLCDGASAVAFYGHKDPRVAAIVMANPWVRSEATQAEATLKHHYRRKLTDPETWRRLVSGKIAVGRSLASIGRAAGSTLASRGTEAGLPERVLDAMSRFPRPILLFLSGNDFTAREFLIAADRDPAYSSFLESDQVTRHDLPEANHTFSLEVWRDEVAARTIDWIKRL